MGLVWLGYTLLKILVNTKGHDLALLIALVSVLRLDQHATQTWKRFRNLLRPVSMESFTSQFPTRETLIWNGSLPQCKVSWHGFIPYFTIHGSHLSLSSLSSPRGPGEEKSRWNEGRASVQVSRRFQSFGNSADKFRGHETNPFSLLPVSCKKLTWHLINYAWNPLRLA